MPTKRWSAHVECQCGLTVPRSRLAQHRTSSDHRRRLVGRSLTRLSPPLPDDTEAEPLTWGADGRLPRPRSLDERDGEHDEGARRAVGRYTPEILT